MRKFLWLLWALVASTSAYADGISGTYVGKRPNGALFLQIVETQGGHLTGRFEQTVLTTDGKLTQASETVSGVSDGHTVVLTIKPNTLLPASITASGTIQGGLLHLSSSSFRFDLATSDEAAYRALVADLGNEGNRIAKAKDQADEFDRLNKLITEMVKYSAAAEGELPKVAPIEQRYRTITELMNAALSREQMIYGGARAFAVRNQISGQINQAEGASEQLHASVAAVKAEIIGKIGPVLKDAIYFKRRCQSGDALNDSNLHDACTRFTAAVQSFAQSMGRLDNAFNHVESVWVVEHAKQAKIIQASTFASR